MARRKLDVASSSLIKKNALPQNQTTNFSQLKVKSAAKEIKAFAIYVS